METFNKKRRLNTTHHRVKKRMKPSTRITGWFNRMNKRSIIKFSLSLTQIDPEKEYAKIINYVSVAKLSGIFLELRRLPLMMKSMRKTPKFDAVYSNLWGTILWFATNQLVITGNRSLPQIRLVVRLLLLTMGEGKLLTELILPPVEDNFNNSNKLPIERVKRKYVKMYKKVKLVSLDDVNVVGSGPGKKGPTNIDMIKELHPNLNWQKEFDEFSWSATWVTFPISMVPIPIVKSLNLERYTSKKIRLFPNDKIRLYKLGNMKEICRGDKKDVGDNMSIISESSDSVSGDSSSSSSSEESIDNEDEDEDECGDEIYKNGCIVKEPVYFKYAAAVDPWSGRVRCNSEEKMGRYSPVDRGGADILPKTQLSECSVHIFPEHSNCVIMKMYSKEGVTHAHRVICGILSCSTEFMGKPTTHLQD